MTSVTAISPAAEQDPEQLVAGLGKAARAAARIQASADADRKNDALRAMAAAVRAAEPIILAANAEDLAAADAAGIAGAMRDRLALTPERLAAIAAGLEAIAELPDPVGQVMAAWDRPNGLNIERVRVPIGVIGVIYESRPNVTADAGGLCVKAGNAVILRGGSESSRTSGAIAAALRAGLEQAGLPADAVQIVPTTDRAAVGALLRAHDFIDVIVPRGGKSLIARVLEESRVPVFAHLAGLCHVYVDGAADPGMAVAIVQNAKMRRTGICGAAETVLVDRAIAEKVLPAMIEKLAGAGCEIRGDNTVQAFDQRVKPAAANDWDTEYLDAIISVAVVDGLEAAIEHINRHGSHHTDSIVTGDALAAERFLNEVDSAIVLHNASTQFADGGEFGMGAEIGIATGRLHARGPVGAEQLTTYKYRVRGNGQLRP